LVINGRAGEVNGKREKLRGPGREGGAKISPKGHLGGGMNWSRIEIGPETETKIAAKKFFIRPGDAG